MQNSGWEEHIKVLQKENEIEVHLCVYRSCCGNLEENHSGKSQILLRKGQEKKCLKLHQTDEHYTSIGSSRSDASTKEAMNALSWSLSALESYPTVRAGGGSFPSRSLPTRQTLPGKGCSSQGPSPWPLSFLYFENCR